MEHPITLKAWAEGSNPDDDDVLAWSNLILQRSLQTNNCEHDPVSQHFLSKWLAAKKDRTVAPVLERTFSRYGAHFTERVIDTLIEQNVLKAADILDHTRHVGPLKRAMLLRQDIWLDMSIQQLHDHYHSFFSDMLREQKHEESLHPAWSGLQLLKTATEREHFFRDILGPRLCREFGFFNDERGYHDTAMFHRTLSIIASAWNVHPAKVMYGVLKQDHATDRDYHSYMERIEPYANDIRELIQFSTRPQDVRIRRNLPDSSKTTTLDFVVAFSFTSDPGSLFIDPAARPDINNSIDFAQAFDSAV